MAGALRFGGQTANYTLPMLLLLLLLLLGVERAIWSKQRDAASNNRCRLMYAGWMRGVGWLGVLGVVMGLYWRQHSFEKTRYRA